MAAKAESDVEMQLAAQALYDKNLGMLVEKAKEKRSMYRVVMDESGIILGISKARASKPKQNSFLFIVPGNSKVPKFGNMNGLNGFQLGIAQFLEKDLRKLFAVNEVAYRISSSAETARVTSVSNRNGKNGNNVLKSQLDQYSKRFGTLPKSELEIKEESRRKSLKNEEMEKMEKLDALNAVQESVTFEELLAKERRRMAKRDRKKSIKARVKVKSLISSSSDSDSDYDYEYEDSEEKQSEEKQQDDEITMKQRQNRYFKYYYLLNNHRYQYIYIYT